MTNSSGMSWGGVKKQLSRIKEVNFRLSQVKGADSNLKSMQFDIGILAKCCEKLLQDNDELREEIKQINEERAIILKSKKDDEAFHDSVMNSALESME